MAMTLDQLLALLPDNTAGDIGADDLRTITTELFNGIQTVRDTIALTGTWQINSNAGADPGGAQVTCDTGSFFTATSLRFAAIDKDNIDQSAVLLRATEIYGQQYSDAANWVRWAVSDPPSAGVGFVDVPVAGLGGGGSVGSVAWQTALFVIRQIPS